MTSTTSLEAPIVLWASAHTHAPTEVRGAGCVVQGVCGGCTFRCLLNDCREWIIGGSNKLKSQNKKEAGGDIGDLDQLDVCILEK